MDWAFVNEVLGMREEGSQLPFPHPVSKSSFFQLSQIDSNDPYRAGMDLLIEASINPIPKSMH